MLPGQNADGPSSLLPDTMCQVFQVQERIGEKTICLGPLLEAQALTFLASLVRMLRNLIRRQISASRISLAKEENINCVY